jgi:hypothetical protein
MKGNTLFCHNFLNIRKEQILVNFIQCIHFEHYRE